MTDAKSLRQGSGELGDGVRGGGAKHYNAQTESKDCEHGATNIL